MKATRSFGGFSSLAEYGWPALLVRCLPPRADLPGARSHISPKVFGCTRKLEFMVVAPVATRTSHVDPNPRQDKDHQENHPGRDERSTHVGSKKRDRQATCMCLDYLRKRIGCAESCVGDRAVFFLPLGSPAAARFTRTAISTVNVRAHPVVLQLDPSLLWVMRRPSPAALKWPPLPLLLVLRERGQLLPARGLRLGHADISQLWSSSLDGSDPDF